MKCEFWEIPNQVGDIAKLRPKTVYTREELAVAKDLERFSGYEGFMTRTFGVTPHGKDPITLGVCGVIRQWTGFATCWFILDERSDKYPLALVKSIDALSHIAQKSLELRRISFTVRSDYTKGQRFAEMFGYQSEGYLRSYLPDGSDVILYARVFK